jgi:hypothetical protein
MHPVLLVALYAAAGIGLVVLASAVLLGGTSTPPKPVRHVTVKPTPAPVGSAVDPTTPVGDTGAQKAQDAERQHLQEQLRTARHQLEKARHAATKARNRAAHKKHRPVLKHAPRQPVAPAATAAPTQAAPAPQPTYAAPAPQHHSSGGSGGKSCEFCLG